MTQPLSPETHNDPQLLAKLLRAIAGGENAKSSKHDIIFLEAARWLEHFGALAPQCAPGHDITKRVVEFIDMHDPFGGTFCAYDVNRIEAALSAACEPCEYCGPGVRTGLPGNACENCINTGLKYPALTSTERDSPVMGAAKRAAKVVDGWSDAKRDYADRVTSTVQPPIENKDGGCVMSGKELDKREQDDADKATIYESFRKAREIKDWGPEQRPQPDIRLLLDEVLTTLRHAHVFITSRERMHIDGVALYDDTIEHVKAALVALTRPNSKPHCIHGLADYDICPDCAPFPRPDDGGV